MRRAPAREPLFDDEIPTRHLLLVGRHELALPFGERAEPTLRSVGPDQRMVTKRSSGPGLAAGPDRTERADHPELRDRPPARGAGALPEPVRFGRFFIQAVLEVLSGRRPAAQLARHTSPRVHAGLAKDQARGGRFKAAGRNPLVHSVRVMEPAHQVAELSAVVQVGERFRAIAARLELHDGQWRCVQLQIG